MQPLATIEAKALKAARVDAIDQAMREARGSVKDAADKLGIARQNLYQHARVYGIDLAKLRRRYQDA